VSNFHDNESSATLSRYVALGANGCQTNRTAGGVTVSPSAGVTTATGITNYLGDQATAGQGSDYLVYLYHSVLPEYRADASTAFGMADSSAGIIRKLKGSDGSPVWQPALTAGAPDLLLGKPVKIVPDFDSFGASKKPIFFGDWSALKLRIAGGLRIDRSADVKFANDQIAFRVIVRTGGLSVDGNAVKYLATGAAS
jgi:HK97 family phage major capsid protein